MNITEIENSQKKALEEHIMKGAYTPKPRWSNWAGDLGFPCDTYQSLCRLKGELKPIPDVRLMKIFRTGTIAEDPNYELIKKAGIEIYDRIGSYQWREKEISGRLDFKIKIPHPFADSKATDNKIIIPLEHKATSPNSFESILRLKKNGESMTNSEQFWVRKYPGQLTMYDIMDNSEFGEFFFYNKQSGDFFFWLIPLDLEYGEELLQRAERSNLNVKNNTIPKSEFSKNCQGCDFERTYCFPDRDYGEGFQFINDEEICQKFDTLKELEKDRDKAKKYETLKSELMGTGTKPGILYAQNCIVGGKYRVVANERKHTKFTIPAEIKAQYAEKGSYFVMGYEEIGEEKWMKK